MGEAGEEDDADCASPVKDIAGNLESRAANEYFRCAESVAKGLIGSTAMPPKIRSNRTIAESDPLTPSRIPNCGLGIASRGKECRTNWGPKSLGRAEIINNLLNSATLGGN